MSQKCNKPAAAGTLRGGGGLSSHNMKGRRWKIGTFSSFRSLTGWPRTVASMTNRPARLVSRLNECDFDLSCRAACKPRVAESVPERCEHVREMMAVCENSLQFVLYML